ncbi:MAG: putative undecaprenyl-phosphate glycosyl-phosphate transferase [Thermoleophilia bacterium]|nr:putative undecaprenyl-phosphate glycosyl-phosphate transferase [Thermoleophilia bacterium]
MSGVQRHPVQRALKWLGDRLVALVATIIASPVLLALAIAVLIDAGRPVFFVQRRTGKHGREFPMLKFRSMVNDAVKVGQELGVTDDPHGVVKNDPRITATGRFLRRTSLDELPQLLNVLVGQMSLVGPRPDIPEQSIHYSEHDKRRLEVLPGITGYSQVHGRDEIEWPERIEQDIHYIDTWTLWQDLKLVVLTFGVFGRSEPDPVFDSHNASKTGPADEG